jgi:hypothetical protein
MDTLRTAVSLLGAADPAENDNSPEAVAGKALRLFAALPAVVALDQRRRRGFGPIAPRDDLGFAANFLYMTFGELPEAQIVSAFETSLILYAEHSFNASTFTARVVASTLSDIYSAVTAAIGALKGSLHGGANEAVMDMMTEIAIADNAAPWLEEALAGQRKIMGFGHRVYKHGDSRVPAMREALEQIAAIRGGHGLIDIYETLAKAMHDAKGLHPNLDYPAGPAYHLIGFDTPAFTPSLSPPGSPAGPPTSPSSWPPTASSGPLPPITGRRTPPGRLAGRREGVLLRSRSHRSPSAPTQVERGQNEQVEQCGGGQPAKDHHRHRVLDLLARLVAVNEQRRQRQGGGQRGHQDRRQPLPSAA